MRRFIGKLSVKPAQISRRHGKASRLQATLHEAKHVFGRCIEDFVEAEEALAFECNSHAKCQELVEHLEHSLDEERHAIEQLRVDVDQHAEAIVLRDAEIRGMNLAISAQEQRNANLEAEGRRLQEVVASQRSALSCRDEELEDLRHSRSVEQQASRENVRRLHQELSEQQAALSRCKEELCRRRAPEEDVQSPVRQSQSMVMRRNLSNSPFSRARPPPSPFAESSPASPSFRERSRRRSSSMESPSASGHEDNSRIDASSRSVCRVHAMPKRRAYTRTAEQRSSSSSTPFQEARQTGQRASGIAGEPDFGLSPNNCLQRSSPFASNESILHSPAASDDSVDAALRTKLRPLSRSSLEDSALSWSPCTPACPSKPPVNAESRDFQGMLPPNSSVHQLTAADLRQLSCNFSSCIGAGSFGQVFAGKAGTMAVKVPRQDATHVDAQFLREMRVAEFADPCLMPLVAVCMELRALVYPRAEGTLEDVLRTSSPPDPSDGLTMLLGSARGLLALHSHGFIHRDVKSANIFVFAEDRDQPTARLGDFGLVWEPGQESPLSFATVVGTASYLDPEAVASGHCSHKSDIFSLGVVMLEVLLRRSVTELPLGSGPLWRQLHDAVQLPCTDTAASAAAAAAFARGAGASHSWTSQALEATVRLVMEATLAVADAGDSERPEAFAVVERLESAKALQESPMPADGAQSGSRVCSICFESLVKTRFRPCFHALACETCAELFINNECPMCRGAVESFDIGQFESTFVPV